MSLLTDRLQSLPGQRVLFLFWFIFLCLVAGCSTWNAEENRYESDSPVTFTGSFQGAEAAILGGIGVIAGMHQLSTATQKFKRQKGLFGRCTTTSDAYKEIIKNTELLCQETFVEIFNHKTKHVTKVWIDEQKTFSFEAKRGEKFTLKAVNRRLKAESKKIIVFAPEYIEFNF